MASDDFASANSPLASPWTGFGGSFGNLRSTSGGCRNVAGSDADAGAYYSSSSAQSSQVDYVSGSTDGGPALNMGVGPDGYVDSAYNGTEVFTFRVDDGSVSAELGHATGVYVATQAVRLRRSGNNLITSLAGVDTLTVTDATYTGGSPGVLCYSGDFIVDNWTDGAAGAFSLTIGQLSYALSLQAVTLKADRPLTIAQLSYALTLQSVSMIAGPTLQAGQISYALSLQDVSAKADRTLPIGQLSYALSLQAVTTTGPATTFSLSPEQISYALSLADSLADYEMSAAQISYALTLQDVALICGRKVTNDQLSYALSLQSVGLFRGAALQIDQISYALNLQTLGFVYVGSFTLACEKIDYALNLQQVALLSSANRGEIFHTLPLNWWTK